MMPIDELMRPKDGGIPPPSPHVLSLFLSHLAFAARRAISCRRAGVKSAARDAPLFRPFA